MKNYTNLYNNEELSVQEIITQLEDLACDRESFFREDGDDEVFRQDHKALIKAIQLLEKLKLQ